jgi:hypothetical protein
MSVEAFKFLLAIAVSNKRGISIADALDIVNKKWRQLEEAKGE